MDNHFKADHVMRVSLKRLPGVLYSAFLFLLTLFCGEVTVRWLDGYELKSLALIHTAEDAAVPEPAVAMQQLLRKHSWSIPLADGVERDWIVERPRRHENSTSTFDRKVVENFETRYADIGSFSINLLLRINEDFLNTEVCEGLRLKDKWEQLRGPFQIFKTQNDQIYPSYQLRPSKTYPQTYFKGMTTNNFGWIGPDITLQKPAGTVRIAIVGDSSVAGNFGSITFPDYVGHWLNRWSSENNKNVEFEVLNASRIGGSPVSYLSSLVANEVADVEPDFVIPYSIGIPAMSSFVKTVPGGSQKIDKMESINAAIDAAKYSLPFTNEYSALANRVTYLINYFLGVEKLSEPEKPLDVFIAPWGIDKIIGLYSDLLPTGYKNVVKYYDQMLEATNAYGGRLVVVPPRVFVYPGFQFDVTKHVSVFRHGNSSYWPYSNQSVRNTIDFYHRFLAKYANEKGLLMLPLETALPKDPDLFQDSTHPNAAGRIVMAWVLFNLLTPHIDRLLAEGRLPAPDKIAIESHPVIGRGYELEEFSCTGAQFVGSSARKQ